MSVSSKRNQSKSVYKVDGKNIIFNFDYVCENQVGCKREGRREIVVKA